MAWISASFLTDAATAEPLCDALLEAGALSASIEDADAGTPEEKPQFGEPGMETPATAWDHSRIVALFAEDGRLPAMRAALGASLAEAQWIWRNEGKPRSSFPPAKRYFRRTFALDSDAIAEARIRAALDARPV